MIDINKNYWLIISHDVFYSHQNDKIFLYNTKNGQWLQTDCRDCITFIETMHEHKNLGVVQVGKADFEKLNIYNCIKEALEKNIFLLVDTEKYPRKPIQLMPILNLQNDIDKISVRDKRLIGNKIGKYLLSLTLYLNGECSEQCDGCRDYCKQVLHCTKSKNEIDIIVLESIFSKLFSTNIKTVQLTGGNIFKYSYFEQLIDLLEKYNLNVEFYININNLKDFKTNLSKNHKLHILCHFPFDENYLQNAVLENCEYHFIITSVDEYEKATEIIEKYKIVNSTIQPYFTKNNMAFFKDNVYLNEADILEQPIRQKTIFANQKMNTTFFGNLYVFSDGKVYANPNTKCLGNIKENLLLDLIYKELIDNTAWRKIRDSKPCNECLYQFLCPPISNYELVTGRNNLCNYYPSL